MFDIVIPVGPNDIKLIETQLKYTIKNIIDYRNIFLVCYKKLQLNVPKNVIILDESIFPFSIETVNKYIKTNNRNGWYLQQLIKLYAGFVIPDILESWLVIDADTFFIKPTKFINKNKFLFNYGSENHEPYFIHMNLLHESLIRKENMSGITHHMIFNNKYIKQLFTMIENKHNKKFYEIFLESVAPDNRPYSGASEYEIYFNFMLIYNFNEIEIRHLLWKNNSVNLKIDLKSKTYDYLSYHHYLR